jgi:hypothetical protein
MNEISLAYFAGLFVLSPESKFSNYHWFNKSLMAYKPFQTSGNPLMASRFIPIGVGA